MRCFAKLSLALFTILCLGVACLAAQDAGSIEKKLNAEFSLTKITADRSDIVTAGSVLVLHKDGLLMYSTPTQTPPLNTYKDGRLQTSAAGNYFRGLGGMLRHSGGDSTDLTNIPSRKFVSGEKFWLTGIDVHADGVVFTVYSDPFNDVRYYGQLKFPFQKGSMPDADAMAKSVEEVLTVQADSGNNGSAANGNPAPLAQSSPASDAPMSPIAAPPPPADQPAAPLKTVSLGQSRDDVIATLGQPGKDIKLASKEILVYPDMKVTFVADKVTDVE
jgi:hypothetical protein